LTLTKKPTTIEPQRVLNIKPNPLTQVQSEITFDLSETNRCDLLYGPSGSGKTENIGLLALYVWEKYGKITRLASADGGGWKPLQPYIDLGIIKPLSLNVNKTPMRIMMAVVKGFWVKEVNGQRTWVPLEKEDVEGDEKNGIPGIGGMAFEGITSFGDAIFNSLTRRQDIHIPGAPKDSFVKEGDDYYGFAGPSNYGFVQNRVQEMVSLSNGLPFEKMVWTALEGTGVDSDTKEACYGPKAVGVALTSKIPAWFGDCIHLVPMHDGEVVDDGRKDLHKLVKGGVPVKKVRAYLSNHPHKTTGHMFAAKGRTSAWVGKELPLWFDVVINENERKGLNWLYEEEDRLNLKAADAIRSTMKRKPPIDEFKLKGSSMIALPGGEAFSEKEALQEEGISGNIVIDENVPNNEREV
jgi:hypothetical protein